MMEARTAGVIVNVTCPKVRTLSFTWPEAARRAHHRSRWFGRRYVARVCRDCGWFHVVRKEAS